MSVEGDLSLATPVLGVENELGLLRRFIWCGTGKGARARVGRCALWGCGTRESWGQEPQCAMPCKGAPRAAFCEGKPLVRECTEGCVGLGKHLWGEGLGSPSARGTDTLRWQPSCGGGGCQQGCPAAGSGEDMLGKSLFSFLCPQCMGVASAHISARTHKHHFSLPQPHCSLLPAAVWVPLAGVTTGGKRPKPGEGHSCLHGAGCQGSCFFPGRRQGGLAAAIFLTSCPLPVGFWLPCSALRLLCIGRFLPVVLFCSGSSGKTQGLPNLTWSNNCQNNTLSMWVIYFWMLWILWWLFIQSTNVSV